MTKKELLKEISNLIPKAGNKTEEGLFYSMYQIAEHLTEVKTTKEVNVSEKSALDGAISWEDYSCGVADGAEAGQWAIASRYFDSKQILEMEQQDGSLKVPHGYKTWEKWQAYMLKKAWKQIRVIKQYHDIVN